MSTTADIRRTRLENEYRQMSNLRRQGSLIDWEVISGDSSAPDGYKITINARSIISNRPDYRTKHVVELRIPAGYPFNGSPEAKMVTMPPPFHPNWWANGKWCHGTYAPSEPLGEYVIRMVKTIIFNPDITNPDSPANIDAKNWYLDNLQRGIFPTDNIMMPDPTKSGTFSIQTKSKKKFNIQ